MPTVTRFIGLDLRSLRPYAKYMILPVIIILVAAVLPARSAYAMIPAAAALALVLGPQYLFGNDERGRLDTLYAVLGIPRRQVVTGRYATILLLLVAFTAVALVVAPVTAVIVGADFDWQVAMALAAGSAGVVGVLLAGQLPVHFAVGATRARPVGLVVPAAAILIGVAIGWAFPDAGSALLPWLQGIGTGWFVAAAVLVVGVVGVVSHAIATRLYTRRDL